MATTDKARGASPEATPETAPEATETTAPAKTAEATPATDSREFVQIRHKDQGDDVTPGRVTRRAFDTIWKAKGFEIVEPGTTVTEGGSSE